MVIDDVTVDLLGWTVRGSSCGGCISSVHSESCGYQGVGVLQKQSNQLNECVCLHWSSFIRMVYVYPYHCNDEPSGPGTKGSGFTVFKIFLNWYTDVSLHNYLSQMHVTTAKILFIVNYLQLKNSHWLSIIIIVCGQHQFKGCDVHVY
jgi:hypothetical protein